MKLPISSWRTPALVMILVGCEVQSSGEGSEYGTSPPPVHMPSPGDYSVVRYYAGPNSEMTYMALNLNDSAISVGRGLVCEMTPEEEGPVTETELSEGRRLFTDERMKHYYDYYQAQSFPTVIDVPVEDPDSGDPNGASGAVVDPSNSAQEQVADCQGRLTDDIAIMVDLGGREYLEQIGLEFPAEGVSDAETSEMLEFLQGLASKYGP